MNSTTSNAFSLALMATSRANGGSVTAAVRLASAIGLHGGL